MSVVLFFNISKDGPFLTHADKSGYTLIVDVIGALEKLLKIYRYSGEINYVILFQTNRLRNN